jgi:hypothetical protein
LVKNSPVTVDVLEVECWTIENGDYTLEIIDLLGNTITVTEWTVTANSSRIFDFDIPIQNFSNGVYFVVMNTPTAKYSAGFVLRR